MGWWNLYKSEWHKVTLAVREARVTTACKQQVPCDEVHIVDAPPDGAAKCAACEAVKV